MWNSNVSLCGCFSFTCSCDVTVLWVAAGGLISAAGGQDTLRYFIRARGTVADDQRHSAARLPTVWPSDGTHPINATRSFEAYSQLRNATGLLSCSGFITLRPCASWSAEIYGNNKYLWPFAFYFIMDTCCMCLFSINTSLHIHLTCWCNSSEDGQLLITNVWFEFSLWSLMLNSHYN